MKIIELIINELEDMMGVEAISMVRHPAIESNWIALNKEQPKIELKEIEKKVLLGAALIPNKPIYRKDDLNGEYYIYFSKDTVKKASQMFLKAGNQGNATLEHEKAIDGMTVVESWIVEDKDKDKTALYGIDAPVGTWMVSMKVDNDEIWKEVKLGNIKGFSIEAYFADKYETPQDQGLVQQYDSIQEKVDDYIIKKIKEILTNE